MIGKLADLKIGVLGGCAWCLTCMKAASSAPARYIMGSDNVCITAKEITMMTGTSKAMVAQADSYMMTARRLTGESLHKKANLPVQTVDEINRLRWEMDLRMFCLVMKREFGLGGPTTLADIAGQFYHDFAAVLGSNVAPPLPQGWLKAKPVAKSRGSDNTQPEIEGFNESTCNTPSKETFAAELKARDIVSGSTVTCRKGGAVFTIKSVGVESIVLECPNGGDPLRVKTASFILEYTVKRKFVTD